MENSENKQGGGIVKLWTEERGFTKRDLEKEVLEFREAKVSGEEEG